ncbi:MAG: methionyl-tRNA formyltransferase [Chlamydiales bacterium]|nr:methionyl-tRNA formyltransferase [Chlamydiales bacterium]
MRIVFLGTSSFAASVLEYLFQEKISVVAVVTRPDRPFGRSQRVSSPPVKECVQRLKPEIPLFQPEKASTPEFAEILAAFQADLFVVVAYGEILKKNILDLPKMGAINIHTSLLPKYRGAAPMQRCLMDGCAETGVSIMEMVLQMDAGDLIEVVKLPIPEEMTHGELEKKLCDLARPALTKVIEDFEKGRVKKTPQDPSLVTFAPKITPEEEQIHWNLPAKKIHNLVRALSPFPGAWCFVKIGEEKKRLKIKRARLITEKSGQPGELLSSGKEGLIVACGEQALHLLEVQLEGKKLLSSQEFLRGLHTLPSFQF